MQIGDRGYILVNGMITKVTITKKSGEYYQYVGIRQNCWDSVYPTLQDLIMSIASKEVRDELSSL